MTDHDQPTAGVALKPLDGAFVTVESTGDPKTDKRSATLKITFSGEGSSERAWAARDYLDGLVKAALRAPTDAGGAVSEAAPDLADRLRARLDLANRVSAEAEFTLDEGEIQTVLAALTPAPQAEGRANKSLGQQARALSWATTSAFVEAAKTGAPRPQAEGSPCHHEPYQGACVHCGVPFVNGRPRYPAAQPLQQGGEVTRAAALELFYNWLDERDIATVDGDEGLIDAILALLPAPALTVEASVPEAGNAVRASDDSTIPALNDLAGRVGLLVRDLEKTRDKRQAGDPVRDELDAHIACVRSLAADRDKAVGLLRRWMAARTYSQRIAAHAETDAFLSSQTEGR